MILKLKNLLKDNHQTIINEQESEGETIFINESGI